MACGPYSVFKGITKMSFNFSKIQITDSAKEQIKKRILQNNSAGMQLSVVTTGCSGLSYSLKLVEERDEAANEIIELDEYFVAVNAKDILYLSGVKIDWGRQGLNEGFQYSNPNAVAECGCGESFKI